MALPIKDGMACVLTHMAMLVQRPFSTNIAERSEPLREVNRTTAKRPSASSKKVPEYLPFPSSQSVGTPVLPMAHESNNTSSAPRVFTTHEPPACVTTYLLSEELKASDVALRPGASSTTAAASGTYRTFKRAIRDPPRQGLGLSGALRAADKSDYVTLWILYVGKITNFSQFELPEGTLRALPIGGEGVREVFFAWVQS